MNHHPTILPAHRTSIPPLNLHRSPPPNPPNCHPWFTVDHLNLHRSPPPNPPNRHHRFHHDASVLTYGATVDDDCQLHRFCSALSTEGRAIAYWNLEGFEATRRKTCGRLLQFNFLVEGGDRRRADSRLKPESLQSYMVVAVSCVLRAADDYVARCSGVVDRSLTLELLKKKGLLNELLQVERYYGNRESREADGDNTLML